ncbi:uncharacterized protein [Amphiura filiformis]|uniref:uncharacterized protein n=1 Tax=Amphiura filiformis TaxID=82378 RepID=UPI003B21CCD5
MKILSTILMGILVSAMVSGYPDPLTRETKEDAPDAETINKRYGWIGMMRICGDAGQREYLLNNCGHQHTQKRDVDVKDALAFLQLRDELTMTKRYSGMEYMQEECCEETCKQEEIAEINCP